MNKSFHTKLTLQFKDPILETEYKSFTSSRILNSSFVYLLTLMICQACFFGMSFSFDDLKFKIFQLLLLFVMTFLMIFRLELKKHLENLSFLVFSVSGILTLISFGIHISTLAPLMIFFQMQVFSMAQQTLIFWLFRYKFAILWILLSLAVRFVIYVTSNAEGKHIFGLIASITVDIVFLLSAFAREANERKLFSQWTKYRPQSTVDYQDFILRDLPQGLLVLSENLKKELYHNQSFTKEFMKDESFDSFHRVLATLYVHKADFKSRNDVEELFDCSNNSSNPSSPATLSLYDFLLRSMQANKITEGGFLTTYASYLLQLAPRPSYFEVKIMKVRWGEDVAIVMILNDITEQKNFLATKISDGGKDRFLGTVSHELKTPIHGILTMLNIGLKGTRDPEALQVMNYCKKNTLILLNEVNTLLDLQMIRGNKMRLKPCHFHIEELMNEVTSIFEFHRSQKGITLIFEILDGVPKTICTDKDRLTLILMNLIGNGVKFTNIGGIIIRLGVDPMNTDRVLFEVEDTGIGMTESEQRRICKLYGRADEAEEDDSLSHGAGLGLTVSNLLVGLLNGGKDCEGIRCVSYYQKGSTFSFSVAMDITRCQKFSENEISGFMDHIEDLDMDAKMNLYSRRKLEPSRGINRKVSENLSVVSNCGDYEDHHLLEVSNQKTPTTLASKTYIASLGTTLCSSNPGSNPSSMKSFTGRRDHRTVSIFVTPPTEEALQIENKKLSGWVLLVDDNPMNLLVARRIIEGTGCRVKTAVNGEDAIIKARQHVDCGEEFFKLILMDCQMPVMDGYEATRNLKQMMKSGQMPNSLIVALTANDSKEDVQRCKDSGMDDVLSKPLKDQSLRKIFGYLRPSIEP